MIKPFSYLSYEYRTIPTILMQEKKMFIFVATFVGNVVDEASAHQFRVPRTFPRKIEKTNI